MTTKIRLKLPMTGPNGPIPAGTVVEVDEAEAAKLLSAIGLAEKVGDEDDGAAAGAAGDAPPATRRKRP